MKELVEFIAKSLVDNPDDVSVTQVDGERSIQLELRVAPEDMGKVIGKQGRIAKALRTVLKAAAAKEGTRVVVEIVQ
ncbi:KH domain-containing protein [Desulfitibacter alkalitolerans]|uniref:KH domain-containing protein n=1 Tax=Desulfitibacter alkalitolerans TaxID=264641 RepID=UPI00047F93BB|nr:KH domain-containing protein [Desulfitibacter alkalitolerans]